ncbi:MAG: 5-formyltetrahydrofolate cyclo-ligase [Candidatus Binatia bacterium]
MNAVLPPERRNLLRQAALAQRNSLSKSDVRLWSQRIQVRALELTCYRGAQAIALYSPIQNEVDTGILLDHALSSGKRVYLPRWTEQGFSFVRMESRCELVAGRYGILEPIGAAGLSDAERQNLVVIVPGVVFDCRGNRLGRGSGVYDRLLAQFNISDIGVGLAYECQIVEAVPVQPWDRGMHFVVTENRTIDCNVGSMGN